MATTATTWETRSPAELVAHIITRYHDQLRRDVPPLIEAARRLGRADLAELLEDFWAEMQTHMLKEERVLFPMIRAGARGQQLFMPVRVMEHEHELHTEQLARIRELAGASLTRELELLATELAEHIALENNVLFPRASRE